MTALPHLTPRQREALDAARAMTPLTLYILVETMLDEAWADGHNAAVAGILDRCSCERATPTHAITCPMHVRVSARARPPGAWPSQEAGY